MLYNRNTVQDLSQTGIDTVTATLAGWKNVQQGPYWVPILNEVEEQYSIPTDLLARIAYQESRFRPEIIQGTTLSSAGASGIMQLMPQYFASARRPVPFTESDTIDQIYEAAALLNQLYAHFRDWGLAIAAYNDGQGNIDQYLSGTHPLPAETTHYVTQVLADVPIASAAFSA